MRKQQHYLFLLQPYKTDIANDAVDHFFDRIIDAMINAIIFS